MANLYEGKLSNLDLKARLLPLLQDAIENDPHPTRIQWLSDSDAESFARYDSSFGTLGKALLEAEELSIFRQGNRQYLPNSWSSTTMLGLANWLLQLAVVTRNPEGALEDLVAYTKTQEMKVHHVQPLADIFPEGLQVPQEFPNGVILCQAGSVPNIDLAMKLTQPQVGLPMPRFSCALTKEHRYPAPQQNIDSEKIGVKLRSLIDDQKSAQDLEDVALCLSLSTDVGNGLFGTSRTYVTDLHTPFAGNFTTWTLLPFAQPRVGYPIGPYEIAEGIKLTNFLDSLAPEVAERIRIPIRHLNMFGAHLPLVEKAIHLRVALETTFLDKDNRTELADRIGLRAAIVAGKALEERKIIKATVKKSYSLASTAVHQGSLKQKDFEKLTNAASICQQALKLFLEHGGLPEDWFQIETEGFST